MCAGTALTSRAATITQYSEANLSFAKLKGRDYRVASLLSASPNLVVSLALASKVFLEHDDEYLYQLHRKRGDDVGFRGPDKLVGVREGAAATIQVDRMGVDMALRGRTHELLNVDTEGAFSAAPDDYRFQEYTGNEGPYMEYFYHSAFLVFTPGT